LFFTMFKKIIIVTTLALFLTAVLGVYIKLEGREKRRLALIEAQKNAKAAEISITLIEGWNNKEIAAYLEKENILPAVDFLASIKNFNTLEYQSFLPKEAVGDLQGFLYPDTYRLFASVSDRTQSSTTEASVQIISKLLDNFEKKLPSDAAALAKKQGVSLYEAIILASVVEKETGRTAITEAQKEGLNSERKIVAGIFYNRLNIGMALESDATVNYVTGKSDPAVSLKDLEVDSPYNTYKYRGLPPTPICNPSLSSIMAVLNPTDSNNMYFLHDQETGKAYYAITYEEHLRNKQKYLR
jgi:UPF0755 protein